MNFNEILKTIIFFILILILSFLVLGGIHYVVYEYKMYHEHKIYIFQTAHEEK